MLFEGGYGSESVAELIHGRMLIGVVSGESCSTGREGVGYGARAACLGVGGRRRLRWRDGYVGGRMLWYAHKTVVSGPCYQASLDYACATADE